MDRVGRRIGNIRNHLSGKRLEKARRIVMVRQEIDKRPKAAGKQIRQLELFEDGEDFGKYRYGCFVTDLELPAKCI